MGAIDEVLERSQRLGDVTWAALEIDPDSVVGSLDLSMILSLATVAHTLLAITLSSERATFGFVKRRTPRN